MINVTVYSMGKGWNAGLKRLAKHLSKLEKNEKIISVLPAHPPFPTEGHTLMIISKPKD